MLKKAFLIIVPTVLIIALIFVYGIMTYNSKYMSFQADGHFIAKSSKSTTEKYFFDTETKYKTVDDEVIINNKDNNNVVIPADTFIHYTDGSISTFSKSVVLDLDNIDKENYTYYNVFSGTIFVKNGTNYSINYLDKKLNFSNFLLKINDDKFMIIGKKMKLNIGDNSKTIENNYLEITYLEGNIIKVENQGVAYQSVSDQVNIEIGDGTVIDFIGKNIFKNDKKKLSLGEITVDSDDNIEISADDNKSITGEKDDKDKKESNGGNGSNNNDEKGTKGKKKYTKDELPDISSGVVNTTPDSLEEIVDANARIKDAEFKIINLDVTANRIRAEIQVTDEADVLEGDINIKIIETNTNKVVYETNDDSGSNIIEIENETLTPETNYILVLNSDYKKNDITYNKDFVQKTFITDAIGVDLEKYFVSDKELQVNLKKSSYSDVVSVDVALEDVDNKTLKTLTVPLEGSDNIVEFKELVHDTKYKVRVYNFIYKDSIVSDGFTILNSYETLKQKPTIGSTSFVMDKKEGKFNMMVTNVIDPDGGIVSYKYEVYDARTYNAGATPITVVEKNTNASASIKIDGKNIERGVPYIFKVVMTFNDNEKEYDYETAESDVMKIDGVAFPTIRFNNPIITYERIIGQLEILDEGNTMKINEGAQITITYSDTVGNSKSFTSSGSSLIDIDLDNLRKNETYSISVSARVDLDDGNEPIDNCHVGTIVLQTKDPNPFRMNYMVVENPSYAFNLEAQLIQGSKGSTELEASTLTGISFNLYQGRNTSGTLLKTITIPDKNDDHYGSDIKDGYYDSSFIINPAFFGLKNSDLTSEYYTIEATGAHDYVKPIANGIDIENSTITVKVQQALPDLPPNPSSSVDFVAIRNRDLDAEHKREDLLDGTTVGYKFKSIYNNEAKYAKTIHYKVHDKDGNVLKTIDYTVPVTGTIDYSELNIGDGLENGITDGNLHRGQQFYITYTIDLDTNYDGTVDVVYPLSGTLRSKTISPERQRPTFEFYPSVADNSSYTWKYTYKDVDHTLLNKQVKSYLNGNPLSNKELTITNEYKTVKFNINSAGVFAIYGDYNFVDGEEVVSTLLTSQYYEGVSTVDFGKIAIYPEKNRVIFSFLDFESKRDLFNRISAVKIDFVSGNKKVTLDGLSAKTGNITINYSLIESLIGKTITPTVTIYYDSGIYGYDNTADAFAIQQIRKDQNDGLYYYSFENSRFNAIDTANGSYVTYNLDINNKKLSIHDKVNNTDGQFNILPSKDGISYNSTYISPKKLYSSNGVINGDTTFEFDTIIPGISILNEEGVSSISPLINTASFKISAYGVENQLQNNKVYIELYKATDDTASDATLERTLEYSLDDLNNVITIDNLVPQTNYYFRVYGNVKKADGTYDRSYLYDVNQQRDGVNYYFKTIGNVGINNLSVKYSALSYTNRRLEVKYKLSHTIGYSYIKYNVYRIINDEEEEKLTDVVATPSTLFKENMTAYILIPNTSGFVTGDRYRVEVQPVLTTTINGVKTDYELESESVEYKFNTLYKPYFNIMLTSSGDTLSYRVNIKDYHKAIVDGNYKIKMTDQNGVDITPSEYKNKEYNINNLNTIFEISGLQKNVTYTFSIMYDADLHNDASRIEHLVYNRTTKLGNSSIYLGTIYADTDISDTTKVNLRFFDSYLLTNAKTMRYSIYDESGFSIDNQVSFRPRLVTSGSTTYYEFQLPDIVSADGIYYISMQFLNADGALLAEDTVEYRLL